MEYIYMLERISVALCFAPIGTINMRRLNEEFRIHNEYGEALASQVCVEFPHSGPSATEFHAMGGTATNFESSICFGLLFCDYLTWSALPPRIAV